MRIETFVFINLEGTGLPINENDQTKTTELAFIAVSRSDLENASVNNLPPTKKISCLFNPEREVSSEATDLTGLTQKYLADKPLFKDKIEALNEFLDLPKPVCIVAHSGNRFDFRLLRAEYNDAAANLPSDLVCVDTFFCFKDILPKYRFRSLALKNVYKIMMKKEPSGFRRAESGCQMMFECVLGVKNSFIEWADKRNLNLSEIQPLR